MQGQYYRLLYHMTWATKMRASAIDAELKEALHKYLSGKALALGGRTLAVGGTDDHVHLVVSLTPGIKIATFIGQLKGASSHWVNHVFRPGMGFEWQGGYGAFTIADSILENVKSYVKNQEKHHKRGSTITKYEVTGSNGNGDGGR